MLIEISNHRIGEVQHQQEGAKGLCCCYKQRQQTTSVGSNMVR
ncbi:hypothetical protein SOVF_165450 [Spinacia oleracea]|nr:hypothetical protein SOVF_165450 [Spinacia oleracea]